MTGRDLVTGALRLIGVVASGEALDSAQATDGLSSLNDMIDSWSNDDLLIPAITREVFPLTAGQQTYTIGSGGNFNTARPMTYENAWLQVAGTSPALELPIKIVTEAEFARIPLKGMTSTYPAILYSEDTYPLDNINLWPIPSQSQSLVLYTSKPLANLTLDTAIALPKGYNRALRYNLAIELAPEYGKTPSEIVAEIAIQSLSEIKRANFKPVYMTCDLAVLNRSPGGASPEWAAMIGTILQDIDGGTF
jgi:hypothetical protein